jgi:threonine/homoserine/homoserine lactone efflux protein
MPLELVFALALFALVMAGTPGPNNMMVMASGLNFGFRRTLPHMFGIAGGFGLMCVLVGLGLGQVFATWPVIYTLMRLMGVAYLLWLAIAIWRSGPIEGGGERGKPLSFLEGALFQWVNPKAWVIAVGAVSAYGQPGQFATSVAIIGLVMAAVTVPCVAIWTAFGASLRAILTHPRQVIWFNRGMATLLILSLWPILADLITR